MAKLLLKAKLTKKKFKSTCSMIIRLITERALVSTEWSGTPSWSVQRSRKGLFGFSKILKRFRFSEEVHEIRCDSTGYSKRLWSSILMLHGTSPNEEALTLSYLLVSSDFKICTAACASLTSDKSRESNLLLAQPGWTDNYKLRKNLAGFVIESYEIGQLRRDAVRV